MAGSFRIAEGYVEVTADESNYDRAMDRLKAKKHQVKVGVQLDDTAALAQLTRFVRDRVITAKVNLDQTALAALGRNLKVDIAPNLNAAAAQRVTKALDRLTADRVVQIRANADTRVAADEIRNLVRRQQVRIGIDVDTRVAADSIANLTRTRTMRINANAVTAGASASLAHLTRDRTVNIRTNMTGLGSLGSIGGSLGSAGSSAGALGGQFAKLAAAAVAALPAVASLGQSIMAMGPAAAVAVPAVGALTTMGATLAVGLHGIGDAFKAAFAPASQSAATALSATKAVESAQRSLAKAQQGVKDAEVNAAAARVAAARQIRDAQLNLKNTVSDVADSNRRAAESVAQAEQDLADAQRDARQAQLDLTQARKDAAQQLEDLANQQKDAELDHRDAILRVQDAKDALDQTLADPKATQRQRDEAQLTYDQAVQHLAEQELAQKRLAEEAAAANKAGVEGSDQVTKAKKGVADANQTAADKAKALKDAEIEAARSAVDGAQKVAKAERDVADARAAATKAATDGARAIADAQGAVADAASAVADAQTSAALKTNTFADAMAKLSPNARSFISAVKNIAPAWSAVRMDVQDALFRGFGDTLRRLSASVLPSVRDGLVGMAGVLNNMGRDLMDTFARLGDQGLLKKMFSGFTAGMAPLTKVPGQLGKAFVQLSIAAAPAFKKITTAAGGLADRLSKQLTQAFESGHLEKVINQALKIAVQFGRVIGDIFGTVGNVMKAAGKGGGDALGALGAVFKEMRRVTALPEVQKGLTAIFKMVTTIAKLLAGAIGTAVMQLAQGFGKIAPAITSALGGLTNAGPLIGALLLKLNPVLGALLLAAPLIAKLGGPIASLITAVAPMLQMVSDFTNQLITSLAPVIGSVLKVLAATFTALAPVVKIVLGVMSTLIAALATSLVPVIDALIPVVSLVGQFLGQLAPVLAKLVLSLLPLLPPISQLAVSLVHLAMQVLTPLLPLVMGLANLLAGTLAGAIGILVPVITTVVGWLTKFADAASAAVKWVVEKFQYLYDVLVGHSIIPDLVKAIISWFTSLWDKTKKIFTDLKNGVVNLWNSLWTSVRNKWDGFWGGLKSAISGAKTTLTNWASSLRTSITGTWSNMWNSARDKVTGIFSTINSKIGSFKSSMKTAFSTLRDSLGTIWNGIRSKFSSPIKFVIGSVYNDGVRKMWNTIASKISSKITLPAIKLGFAKGGVVPGFGTGDTVPAMLTPNERVLSLPQVAKLGGHRAIDAMLGQDRSQGSTGGNPSTKQEQGRQGYADGGIIGSIADVGKKAAGALGGGLDWAKDLVVGGLADAARKAISSLVRPLINRIPGGSFGGLMKGMSNKALNNMLGFLGNEDDKAVGGPAVQKALSWARTQDGKPYQWGGNGNPSFDCSGLVSAIESVIRGESPHRRWATGSFSGSTAPAGWVRNLMSPFMIGVTNAGVGHTAGTLGGVNVESRGGDGIVIGKGARGYNNSLFTDRYGFEPATKYDNGGILAPGATMVVNGTQRPERILDPVHTAKLDAMLSNTSSGPGGVTVNMTVNSLTMPSASERKQFANAMASDINEALRKWNRDRA